ncbi:hypothetical protein AB0904_24870 [Streptomyces sp. NPDC006684]|uniref:hypothetical protein n=1 Tax=Streptomyces sp. NPDC006684 TaxID=3154477 RepID=UPI0034525493
MESPGPSFRRRLLIESLTVLAADASVQVAWLEKHRVVTDEIALDFDHAFRMAERLVEEVQVGQGALPDLREIDLVFSGMSGAEGAGRWARTALSTDAGWAQARQLARQVLVAELGEWNLPLPEIDVIR